MSKFTEKAEQYTVEIINGRNRTRLDRLYRLFLFMLSHIYRFVVQTRIMLYEKAFLRRKNIGSFVVSIGNLTTGGTGKTPVVEILAKNLAKRGRNVAILSRGYRSKSRTLKEKIRGLFHKEMRLPPKVVSDGRQMMLDSFHAGDEPFMLARNLLACEEHHGVAVVVDKDRVYGGKYAIRNFHSDTLLLDDGFQYMRLRPRINIVLVDTTSPFHNHEVLPIGLLREPIEHISKADYIFLTKCRRGKDFKHLRNFLHKHNHHAPIIECNHEPCHLSYIDGTGNFPLDTLKGKKVSTICGIAMPQSFEAFIEQLGAEIVYKERFVDHHRYTDAEIRNFCRNSSEAGAELYITTEKDAVRINPPKNRSTPFFFLRVEIVILRGQEHFEDCLTKICMK